MAFYRTKWHSMKRTGDFNIKLRHFKRKLGLNVKRALEFSNKKRKICKNQSKFLKTFEIKGPSLSKIKLDENKWDFLETVDQFWRKPGSFEG